MPARVRSLEVAFLAVVALLPFMDPAPAVVVAGLRLLPVDVAVMVATVAWLHAAARRRVVVDRPLAVALLGYVAVLVVVAILAGEPTRQAPVLAAETSLPVLALLGHSVVRDDHVLRRVVLTWLAATGVVVAGGLVAVGAYYLVPGTRAWGLLAHYGTLPPGNYPRVSSFLLGVTYLASYLTVGFLLLLAAGQRGWLPRWLAGAGGVGIAVVALASFAPVVGWLPLGAALWWYLARPGRSVIVPAAGAVVAVAFLVAALPSPAVLSRQDPLSQVRFEPSSRVLAWGDGVRAAGDHPWVGHGLGAAPVDVSYRNAAGELLRFRDPHNGWLDLVVQKGLLGAAAFLVVVAVALRRVRWRGGDPVVLALALSLVGLVGYQFLLSSLEQARHLWVLVGVAAAAAALTPSVASRS